VTQKPDRRKGIPGKHRRFNPYKGREAGVPLTSDAHLLNGEENPVTACFETVFEFASALVKCRMAGGVFAHREVAWHFRPHRITPNAHLLVNTPGPIGFDLAVEMLFLLERLYLRQRHGRCLYPDLHIEPILSQKEITRWIFSMLKPMDYVTGYLQSVQAGVDLAALNLEVDDRIFQGGSKILSVRSPRRFGNLRCNVDGYIGSGSITAWRKAQAERRKAEREQFGLHMPKPPTTSRLGRIIDREADRIEVEV
jgi:hypothetical protein